MILGGTKSPCVPPGRSLCAINSGQTKQTEFMSAEPESVLGVYRLPAPGEREQERQNEKRREGWAQSRVARGAKPGFRRGTADQLCQEQEGRRRAAKKRIPLVITGRAPEEEAPRGWRGVVGRLDTGLPPTAMVTHREGGQTPALPRAGGWWGLELGHLPPHLALEGSSNHPTVRAGRVLGAHRVPVSPARPDPR